MYTPMIFTWGFKFVKLQDSQRLEDFLETIFLYNTRFLSTNTKFCLFFLFIISLIWKYTIIKIILLIIFDATLLFLQNILNKKRTCFIKIIIKVHEMIIKKQYNILCMSFDMIFTFLTKIRTHLMFVNSSDVLYNLFKQRLMLRIMGKKVHLEE